ncbi:MAG: M1 family aminopeptidase [Bacteroidales bacterium]
MRAPRFTPPRHFIQSFSRKTVKENPSTIPARLTKYFLVLASSLISLLVIAQDHFIFNPVHHCAHAKISGARLKTPFEIIQSPLLMDYDVTFYHLNLEVSDQSTYISGDVTIHARVVAEQLDTLAIELINLMDIEIVKVNAVSAGFLHTGDEVFIPLAQPLLSDEIFTVQIFYHGIPPAGNFFNGVTTAYDSVWNKHVTWTLSEPFNARQWWPVKQVLEDKADSVWVFLTTDAKNKAGSNGLLKNVVNLPDNKVRYEWKSGYPIAYYLISFAVAEYQDYSVYAKPGGLNNDSVLIQHYIYNSPVCLEHYKTGLDRTTEMVELFSDLYSIYPFHEEKYGHCLAKISGGMEHQTMTTINNFGLLLVAHELGHSWFGNHVTCATWSDIWINEGFATYTDYLAHEKLAGGQWPAIWMQNVHAFITSEPYGSVYVPPDEITYDNVERIFDARLTYYKGALLLHMIRYMLNNDDLFFQSFKNFQAAFADSIATALDFLDILNQTTNQDFATFFDQWFFGEGYPMLSIHWKQTGNTFELTSLQTTSAPEITPLFYLRYPVRLFFNSGTDTTVVILHDQPLATISADLPFQVDSVHVDPELWILKKVVSINGVNDQQEQMVIGISPNPFTNRVTIRTAFLNPYSIRVINLTGEVLSAVQANESVTELNLSFLKNGLYLLTIEGEGQPYTTKIVRHD